MAGPSGRRKLVAALSYAASSVLIMVVNKMVLTAWKFPSAKCLALGQFCFASLTILVLSSGPVGMLKVRGCDRRIARQIGPFALLIPANVVSGLMGTRALNLAMFSALRRMSIIMTMILEWAVLRTKPSPGTAAAVFLMIIGAVVAASDDLAFDAHGYMVVFLNNACTAALGVQTKWSLKSGSSSSSSAAAAAGGGGGGGGGAAAAAVAVGAVGAAASKGDSSKLTKFELLYYQSICAIPVLVAVLVFLRPHELEAAAAFEHWTDPSFAVSFCLSLVLGLLLNYASAFCTQVGWRGDNSLLRVLRLLRVLLLQLRTARPMCQQLRPTGKRRSCACAATNAGEHVVLFCFVYYAYEANCFPIMLPFPLCSVFIGKLRVDDDGGRMLQECHRGLLVDRRPWRRLSVFRLQLSRPQHQHRWQPHFFFLEAERRRRPRQRRKESQGRRRRGWREGCCWCCWCCKPESLDGRSVTCRRGSSGGSARRRRRRSPGRVSSWNA